MITVYRKQAGVIRCEMLAAGDPIPSDALWIDMQSPSHEEEIAAEKQLGIQIPSKEEVWKNQVLNRLYHEDNVAYMTAAIINKVDSPYPQTSAVTFILASRYLLTMRYITPTSFQNFALRLQRSPHKFPGATYVLEGLLEEMIVRVAHNAEVVVDMLDELSHSIFGVNALDENVRNPSSQMLQDMLKRLGACADLNSKINISLHSLSRMLCFFRQVNADEVIDGRLSTLTTDVGALTQQCSFLSDKTTFYLDATLGMINVEQNVIIKIFSVVAVFFLPPTLISSMYGMNFQDMPELHWAYGYPMAIAAMMMCAVVPYFYFRRKGWL